MPTLLKEYDVQLERSDLTRRIALPRNCDSLGYIIPPKRTPGLHASGLLKYIAYTARITSFTEQVAEEEMPLRWAMGQAWEEYAASFYPEMMWSPGEVLEPVIATCDGLSVLDHRLCVDEFKFMRSKKIDASRFLDPRHNWLKLQQGMIYCLGYGTDLVRWHIFSALEWPDPKYTIYEVRFDLGELISTDRMIENNRQAAIDAGYEE